MAFHLRFENFPARHSGLAPCKNRECEVSNRSQNLSEVLKSTNPVDAFQIEFRNEYHDYKKIPHTTLQLSRDSTTTTGGHEKTFSTITCREIKTHNLLMRENRVNLTAVFLDTNNSDLPYTRRLRRRALSIRKIERSLKQFRIFETLGLLVYLKSYTVHDRRPDFSIKI